MAQKRWAMGARAVLFGEYVAWISLIAAAAYGALIAFGTSERVQTIWANPKGALLFFSVVHGWLTVPLSIVLAFGYLLRHAITTWRWRHAASDGNTERLAPSRWPIWPAVYGGEAAFGAAVSDVMLLTFDNLKLYNNMHWLLYPWGVMAAALLGVWTLRAVCHPQTAASTAAAQNADADPLDRLWDWFGEATLAAAFGSLIAIVGMAWRFIPGDPFSAGLVPVNLAILAAGTLPIGLMIARRGIAWAWRRWW